LPRTIFVYAALIAVLLTFTAAYAFDDVVTTPADCIVTITKVDGQNARVCYKSTGNAAVAGNCVEMKLKDIPKAARMLSCDIAH
jgi:hypothetical protein